MTAFDTIGTYGAKMDALAQSILEKEGELYGMLRYFMGYADERLNPVTHAVGKRTRPGLLLYIADAFGALDEALPAAVSIELFHNFTLIHDDIEDHDELRRGRPTVWKLWGINKALNAGDAQLILAFEALALDSKLPPGVYATLQQFLLGEYRAVIEGQQFDFELTDASLDSALVNESAYLTMIGKKSAALIAAATKAGGVIAGRPNVELDALYAFGWNLGLVYQLHDDRQSIWATTEKTGKDAAGDIRERKKTLPIIHARDVLPKDRSDILLALYADTDGPIEPILGLLDEAGSRAYLDKQVEAYKEKALESLAHISLALEQRAVLEAFVEELIS